MNNESVKAKRIIFLISVLIGIIFIGFIVWVSPTVPIAFGKDYPFEEQYDLYESYADTYIKTFDREAIDDIILVNDDDAINMSRKLARRLGLGVGISSGANFIGSVLLQEKLNRPIVTVFADDNKKYLSTDLNKNIKQNLEFISNQITLTKYYLI